MAESVARVKIQATADLKGFDDATKALKDLQRAVGPTDAALEQARKEVLDFAAANKRSEAVIQAQLAAFQKLRQQAEMGGKVYNDLGRDIEKLKQVVSSSTGALTKLGQAVNSAGRSTSGQSVWQQQSKELAAFNRQAGQTGKALGELAGSFGIRFEKTSQALQEASRQINILKQNASSIGALGQGPAAGGGAFEIGRKGMRDIGAFSTLVKGLKEQSETATGKVARLSEGLFALGATGAAVGQVTSALGGVAGAAERVSSFGANLSATFAQMGASTPAWSGGIKAGLNQIALALNQPASGIAEWSQSLAGVQAKLTMLNGPLEAFTNGLAAIGPEGAAAAGVMAVAFAGLQDGITRAFRAGEKEASEALQGITNETQQLLQKLSQLSEAFRSAASMRELQALRAGAAARFNETPAGTDASRRAANTIANAEARIKAEGQAQAAVLEQARKKYRGTSESVDALSERLAYLQSAMKLVDQSTTEGKAEFAAFSSEAGRVKKQIDDLSQSYRTVADAIRDAAAAQGQYANQSTAANYLNRAAVRRQEEIAQAAREALARPQMGLLPAAGQTSFSGEYGPGGIGGGARMGTGAKEFTSVLGTEQIGQGITAIYKGLERTQMEADATAAALERGFNRAGAAIDSAEKQVDELQRELNQALNSGARAAEVLTKLDFVNPRSIDALKQRRDQIDRERNSVDMLSKEYRELSRELGKIEGKIERTQVGGLRGKVGYIGQGIGAAASAGIFGGPEGLLGGLGGGAIGALLGGPAGFAAGAFTGSSIGAYAGMGRQQLGGFSTYAADIQKQEIALKGITKTQEEYSRALAASAAVTRDFNVPQLEATRGMTQLSAAVIGAGGNVSDAEVVFRNVTAAIKASGGSSEDVQGSLTALAQIFSKGKVSAEELQGQLGERLPGAVTMFAKATGRTLPQLQKDLEQGVVGLADLMKFVSSDQGLGQFEQRAKTVAQSSAEAGARMTVAFNETKRAIGEALLPLGAELQGAFADFLRDSAPALVKIAEGFVAVARATGTVTKAFMDFTAPLREFFAGSIFAYLRSAKAFWGSLKNDLDSFWGRVGDFLGSIGKAFTGFFDDLKSLGTRALRAVGVDTEWLGKTMDGVVTQLKKAWDSFFDFVKRRWKQTVSNMINYSNPLFFLLKKAGIADVGGAAANGLEAGMTFPEEPGGAGGKKDKPPAPGQLTDWQQQQQQAKDKAAKDAKQLEDDRRRLAEQTAQAQKQLADAVFRYQQELDRKRYELQVELANQLRQNYVDSLVGPRKEVANEFTQLMRDLEQFGRRQAEIAQRIAAARQEIATSETVASVVGQGASMPAAGGNAIFGSTGNVKNAPGWVHGHLQSFGTSAELISQATAMVQRLLSQGVKVYINGVGDLRSNMSEMEIRAAVEAGRKAHTHSGDGRSLDIFVPQGTKVPMPLSGVRSMGSRGGIGGMIDGSNVAVMHLDPASRAGGGKGAIAQAKAVSNVAMEEANLNSLLKEQAQLQQKAGDMIKARIEGYQINRIAPIKQETYQLREQIAALADRSQLELAGVRPEVLDGEMQKAALRRKESEQLAQLNIDLEAAKRLKDPTVAEGVRKSIVDQTTAYQDQRNAIDELTRAQIAFNDAMRFRQDNRIGLGLQEGAQSYIESIGTMREATAQLAQTGIRGVEDALMSLATTGKANFREFAADMLKQTARMIIQQMILRVLLQAVGAIGGGLGGGGGGITGNIGSVNFNPNAFSMPSLLSANGNAFAQNGIQPFAMGGIVNKPTLFKFANGGAMRTGVMGEAGPEAIIPLKRGRDGKLGVSGGGGGDINVSVSVDASGSQVQGDAGQGEQLGRAVAQAVQAELIKQKRPGGLLAA